jgi:hypothetical protein
MWGPHVRSISFLQSFLCLLSRRQRCLPSWPWRATSRPRWSVGWWHARPHNHVIAQPHDGRLVLSLSPGSPARWGGARAHCPCLIEPTLGHRRRPLKPRTRRHLRNGVREPFGQRCLQTSTSPSMSVAIF